MVKKKVRELLKSNVIDQEVVDRLSDTDSLESLNLNSIASIKIIVAIEDTFGIEFDNALLDIGLFDSIEKLSLYIEGKVSENNAK